MNERSDNEDFRLLTELDEDLASTSVLFVRMYLESWAKNATEDNVTAIKSFDELVSIVNSRRDLESADSMEDVVRLLMHRGVLDMTMSAARHDGRTRRLTSRVKAVSDVGILRRMVIVAHAQDPRRPRWLVPTLLNRVEALERTLQSLGPMVDSHAPVDGARKLRLPYDGTVTVVRIKPPEFNETTVKRVFRRVYPRWKDVVANLPDMKLIDILRARTQNPLAIRGCHDDDDDDELDFLKCVHRWILEYPEIATWSNFVETVAKVESKSAEFVRDLRQPI